MIINGKSLLESSPIEGMIPDKRVANGLTYGLSEVGYDLRIKQEIIYCPPDPVKFLSLHSWGCKIQEDLRESFFGSVTIIDPDKGKATKTIGRTALVSTLERFKIPSGLWCEFKNKSTVARMFVDPTLGTDGEPGWEGYLTGEIVFNGIERVHFKAGTPLIKAVFHELKEYAQYGGRYQNQPDNPVEAIYEGL